MRYFIVILTFVAFLTATPAIAASESIAGAAAVITDNSKTKVNDRDHMTGGNNVMGRTHALFYRGDGTDVSFRPVKELIRWGGVMNEQALKNLAKGGDVDMNFPVLNWGEKSGNWNETMQQGFVKICVVAPESFKMTAIVDAAADDEDTTSFMVIARLALTAIENGDNVLFIEYEGYKDKVLASGWGIGTHTAGGTISDSGKNAGIAGGGFGYSKNRVGNEMRPWVRGYSGNQDGLVGGDEMLVPKTTSGQTGNHRN
jgi:hypothetical protein